MVNKFWITICINNCKNFEDKWDFFQLNLDKLAKLDERLTSLSPFFHQLHLEAQEIITIRVKSLCDLCENPESQKDPKRLGEHRAAQSTYDGNGQEAGNSTS